MSGTGPRVFLALPLARVFDRALEPFRAELERSVRGLRLQPSGQLHGTLHFFGRVSSSRLNEIGPLARRVCSEQGALRLGLQGFGYFPDRDCPRVLWLGLTGDVAKLNQLQSVLTQALAAAGFPQEDRPFRAHATLGRIPKPSEFWMPPDLQPPDLSPETLDRVALYESLSTPEGSRYEILESYPLEGRA